MKRYKVKTWDEERKKMRKKEIMFWQSIGQIVYDMNCGSVNGFRAGPLEQESIVYLLSEKVGF